MSEPEPGRLRLGQKILIFSAIGVGVGFGLCSLGALSIGVGGTQAFNFAIGGGAILFFTSLLVFGVTAVILIITVIARSFRQR
jgi:hypothetical protein